jgi:hypothetical protein
MCELLALECQNESFIETKNKFKNLLKSLY